MKQTTCEWIEKAEGDYVIVERESRARKSPNYDGVCFHAQQCAEKYLKARLCEAGIGFARIHDLTALLDQVTTVEPALELFRVDLAFLSEFAVAYRYPGESSDREQALDARKRCREFRSAARRSLGLPT